MRRPEPISTRPAADPPPPSAPEATSAVAPVRIDARTREPGGSIAEAAEATESAPSAEAIRVRDVWRAARARRKALRAEVRRFTQRQRRRRAVWLGAAASIVVLVAATVAAAYSPLFAVERITVVGTSALAPSDVERALSDQIGTPLALVDESAVKAALVAFPLVESYSLEAQPPHDLVVRIVERTPVGVIRGAAGFTVVDAAGVALSTAASAPAGQPLLDITGGVGSDAFEAAGRVVRALPDAIRTQLTAVSASTPDDVTLTLGGTGTRIVWGSADESAKKARTLQQFMIGRPLGSVGTYDVSSPGVVVAG